VKNNVPHSDVAERFQQLLERHKGIIRRMCVLYSDNDEQLCRDLIQEVVSGMWLNFSERQSRVWSGAQGAWVYWQTRHFVFNAVRDWRLRERKSGGSAAVEAEEQGEGAEDALVDELAADLHGRERQLLELLRQGYRQKEIAERMGVSLATVKRVHASMVETMCRRAEELGMKKKRLVEPSHETAEPVKDNINNKI
jgi:RNA polymerase sigma factor (sigma-70 family)